MNQQVTISVSEQVMRHARQLATRNHWRVEDVLSIWLEVVVKERPVEELPDDEVLALTELRLTARQQTALSELLERNREGRLDGNGQLALDDLMRVYEVGLLRKSQALRVAVQRGLIAPLAA